MGDTSPLEPLAVAVALQIEPCHDDDTASPPSRSIPHGPSASAPLRRACDDTPRSLRPGCPPGRRIRSRGGAACGRAGHHTAGRQTGHDGGVRDEAAPALGRLVPGRRGPSCSRSGASSMGTSIAARRRPRSARSSEPSTPPAPARRCSRRRIRPRAPGRRPAPARAKRRAELEATIEREEREVARLKGRLGTATSAARPALERELAAAANRLELGRVQLEFLTKLDRADSAAPDEEADLPEQIQALQETLPRLSTAAGTPAVVTTSPRAAAPSGAWALVYRLLALQRHRSALKDLTRSTTELASEIRSEMRATRQTVRPMMARLRELANRPASDGTSGTGARRSSADCSRAPSSSARSCCRYARNRPSCSGTPPTSRPGGAPSIARSGRRCAGSPSSSSASDSRWARFFVGSVLWRIAVVRYVTNGYHRRLLLTRAPRRAW